MRQKTARSISAGRVQPVAAIDAVVAEFRLRPASLRDRIRPTIGATLGSRALIRQPKFPPAVWKITAIEPGKRFTWRSGAPGMWVYAHHSIEPVPGGARATLRLHYEGVIGVLLGRLTRRITDRYLGYEAAGLKQRSESLTRG